MCMIAYQPAGDNAFGADILRNGWDVNHDGAGYMFATNRKLIIRKPFFKLKEFQTAYFTDHAQYGATSHFVLHWRWSTHGKKDEVNTHPHILADGKAALVHNGILSDFSPSWQSEVSDTVLFCRKVLWGRQPSQLTGRRFGRWLAQMIGDRNKLAIMNYRGGVSIVNDSAGVWEGKRWYSNYDFDGRKACILPSTLPVAYTPQGNYRECSSRMQEIKESQQSELWETWRANQTEHEIYDECLDKLIAEQVKAGVPHTKLEWERLDEEAWRMASEAMARDSVA